jgi:hypothetical protein
MKKLIILLSLFGSTFGTKSFANCTYFTSGGGYYGRTGLHSNLQKNGWKLAKSAEESDVLITLNAGVEYLDNPLILAATGHATAEITGLKSQTIRFSSRAFRAGLPTANIQCGNSIGDPAYFAAAKRIARKVVRKMGTCEDLYE